MVLRRRASSVLLVILTIGAGLAAACGSSGNASDASAGGFSSAGGASATNGGGAGGASTMSGTFVGSGGSGGKTAYFPCPGCKPFPGPGAKDCSPTTLGPPTLVYPPDGVLLPPNMNVLEVQWVAPASGMATLYEVDFTNAVTNVKVETPCNSITSVRGVANVGCGLTLSQPEWNDIATANADGDPLKVTVRAAPDGGMCASSSPESVSLGFAKDDLTGGIYYWQSATYGGVAGTTGGIYSHDFGSFDPTATPFWTSGSTGTCVGCHTLSKDGVSMSLMNDDPDADDEFGDVRTLTLDVASRTALGGGMVGPGFQTFSHDHALLIASTFKQGHDASFAVWTSDGTTQLATDPLPGMGMTQLYGTQPNLSFDDKTLVFVAPAVVNGMSTISQAGDHHFLGGSLWSAKFSTAAPYGLTNFTEILTATGQENFYYPDQSVDGNWLVFDENDDTSATNNDGDCFYSRQARVKIMHFPPKPNDKPIDLANLNVKDGLTNSWPRWSPAVQSYKGHQILWVTFSSNRDYGVRLKNTGFDNYYPPESPSYDQPQPATKQGVTFDDYAAPQIWMAAIIVDPARSLDDKDRSYPAFWLPFQDVTAHNHSAQWVSKVQGGGGSGPDGGTCGEAGATCGDGAPACCSGVFCCNGACQTTCVK